MAIKDLIRNETLYTKWVNCGSCLSRIEAEKELLKTFISELRNDVDFDSKADTVEKKQVDDMEIFANSIIIDDKIKDKSK